MKTKPSLFCLAALFCVLPVRAQYAGSTTGLVTDMTSTSPYAVNKGQSDTASCDYRVWTPSRNGYRITEAGAGCPNIMGAVQTVATAVRPADMHRFTAQALSVSLSAVGAESPYEEASTPAAMTRPRRVSPDGGLGEPGAKEDFPIGDVPWLFVLLTAALYALRRYRKCKMAHNHIEE